jgi:RNA polymerase sigma-70 factor (ECF subfamily)
MTNEPNNVVFLEQKSDSEVLDASLIDPSCFEILVHRYQKEFLRKAVRILRNNDEAEDVVQDTFVRMYKYAHKFKHQEGATFKSWAYTILTNTCFTYCKKNKRRSDFISRADDDMLEMYSVGMGDFETMLDMNQITVAISKIPTLLGRMVTLALAGKSQEEIAFLERVPVGTVRTRLHRAKKEIHKVIS